jgi:hypothetical protein
VAKGVKMKNKLSLKQIEIIGAVFGSLLGSLDHFLYDWTHWAWVGIFSPINESPWEHLKLFWFPVLLFLIVEWFWVDDKRKLLFAKNAQIVVGMGFIIGFFYAYTGLFGFENVWIDIASFIAAMAGGYWLSFTILKSNYRTFLPAWFWAYSLVVIFVFFQLMNWAPFHQPIFMDKNDNSYGIQKNIPSGE